MAGSPVDVGDDSAVVDLEGGSEDPEERFDPRALPVEYFIKILVLGDLGVGKTRLLRSYVDVDLGANAGSGGAGASVAKCIEDLGKPRPDYRISVDVGHHLKFLDLGDNKRAAVQLWDIPGHERFGGMTSIYYKYAHGALIVFDLARPETFDTALTWLSDVTEKLFDEKATTSIITPHDVQPDAINGALPVVLLANKSDLPALKVPRHKYSSYVSENGLLAWFETSSKDNNASLGHALRHLVDYILETDPAFAAPPLGPGAKQ